MYERECCGDSCMMGPGYHDDIIKGFVSCSCAGALPPFTTVVAAQLRLRVNRTYGINPLYVPGFNTTLAVDMVSVSHWWGHTLVWLTSWWRCA